MVFTVLLCYRVQVAILHFNEMQTGSRLLYWKVKKGLMSSKYKGGGYVVKKVKVVPTFGMSIS